MKSVVNPFFKNRGLVKDKRSDYKGAIADFNKAIKLKPDHTKAYNNSGIAKFQINRR